MYRRQCCVLKKPALTCSHVSSTGMRIGSSVVHDLVYPSRRCARTAHVRRPPVPFCTIALSHIPMGPRNRLIVLSGRIASHAGRSDADSRRNVNSSPFISLSGISRGRPSTTMQPGRPRLCEAVVLVASPETHYSVQLVHESRSTNEIHRGTI